MDSFKAPFGEFPNFYFEGFLRVLTKTRELVFVLEAVGTSSLAEKTT